MGFVGRHHELNIGTGFVEEVVEDGTRDDVRGREASMAHSSFYEGHAVVGFKFLGELVSYTLPFS